MSEKKRYPEKLTEVLPKRGMVYQESNPQLVLCKPKLLPLKSVTLQKLEMMQREANEKAREMHDEIEREKQEQNQGFIGGGGGGGTSESMTIHDD